MCTYAYVCVCACVCGLHSDHHAIVCVMDEPTSVRCLVVVTTQVVDTVTTIDNVVSDTLVHCVCMCVYVWHSDRELRPVTTALAIRS